MKRIVLLLSLSVALFSCSKNSEQIEVSKKKLLELRATEQELGKYKFDVIEAFDKDIYNMITEYYQNQVRSFEKFPDLQRVYLDKASENLKTMRSLMEKGELKGEKTFYRVHAYRIAGDTLNDKTFFLDDKNNIIFFINKR